MTEIAIFGEYIDQMFMKTTGKMRYVLEVEPEYSEWTNRIMGLPKSATGKKFLMARLTEEAYLKIKAEMSKEIGLENTERVETPSVTDSFPQGMDEAAEAIPTATSRDNG